MNKPDSIINNPAYIGIPSSSEELKYEKRRELSAILDSKIENSGMLPIEEGIFNYLTNAMEKKDKFMSLDLIEKLMIVVLASAPAKFNNVLQLKEIREYLSEIDFEHAPHLEYRDKIRELLVTTYKLGINREFFLIPYDYEDNQDKDVQGYVNIIKCNGLLGELKKYHNFIRRSLCPTNEARYALSILLLINPNGILNAIDIFKLGKDCDVNQIFELVKSKIDELSPKRESIIRKKAAIKAKNALEPVLERTGLDVPAWITRSEFDKANDEMIKEKVLLTLLRNNIPYYERVCDRLRGEALKPELEKIFKESCFSYERLTEEQKCILAAKRSAKDIREMLGMLSSSGFYDDSFPIYDILLLSNVKNIFEINKLLKEKKISILFLRSNPEVFVSERKEELLKYTSIQSALYTPFISNVSALANNKVNTLALSNSSYSDVLLGSSENTKRIVDVINAYGLNYANARDFSLFHNLKLIEKADSFIELGLGEFIKNNPNYICESNVMLNRIRICRFHRIPLIRTDDILRIINSPQFEVHGNLINDNDLEMFILPNRCNSYAESEAFAAIAKYQKFAEEERKYNPNEVIPELKAYQRGNMVYKIGNVIISRQKVLRNLSIIEESELCSGLSREKKLFNAMIYGSHLTDEELPTLSRNLGEEIKKLQID